MAYELKVKSGTYTADNWVELWWVVFRHRLSHFCKDEGFAD
jgi:hypothetical protein